MVGSIMRLVSLIVEFSSLGSSRIASSVIHPGFASDAHRQGPLDRLGQLRGRNAIGAIADQHRAVVIEKLHIAHRGVPAKRGIDISPMVFTEAPAYLNHHLIDRLLGMRLDTETERDHQPKP